MKNEISLAVIHSAMRLYLQIFNDYCNNVEINDRDAVSFYVCSNLIRAWSVAPENTPIIDIIQTQGILPD